MLFPTFSFQQLSRSRLCPLPFRHAFLRRPRGLRAQSMLPRKKAPQLSRAPNKAAPVTGKTPTHVAQLLSKLLSKNAPTLIYEAPSHTGYIAVVYINGALILCAAAILYDNMVIHLPPSIAGWVSMTYRIICTAMAMIGIVAILRASNLVARVTAVPTNGVLRFHIESRRLFPFPFVPRKIFKVLFEDLKLPTHTIKGTDWSFSLLDATRSFSQPRPRPFASRLISSLSACANNQRRVITQEGFLNFQMGKSWGFWKIDTFGAIHPEVASFLSRERTMALLRA